MKKDLISIIVPVYNSEKFIENTIESVINQTYDSWELILVNDCSTDKSEEIIKKYINDKIKLINLERNSGAAVARNKGIEVANGKYIAFLDSDDVWKKEKLEKQINFMKNNKCVFSFTGYEFADENLKNLGRIVKVPQKINYKQALKNTTISTITVMLEVEALGKELVKMPNVKSEDTATWWKILKTGIEAYGMQESLSLYRRSKNTLSSNKFEAIKRIWNLYRNVENLNIIYSIYNFIFYAVNAVKRRI